MDLLAELEAIGAPEKPKPKPNVKLADRLFNLAEGMTSAINHKLADRAERTNKQRSQASAARYEGHNLKMAQQALTALSNGWRRGDLPEILHKYKNKKAVLEAVKCKYHRSAQGFHDLYSINEDEHYDMSDEAVALRDFVWGDTDPEEKAIRQKQALLTQKLAEVRSMNVPGFFPTPDLVIDLLVQGLDLDGKLVLEPSAGLGDIADRCVEMGANVRCVEIRPSLCEILNLKGGYGAVSCCDFLEMPVNPNFDVALMNPPFEHNMDIDHVLHAASFLKSEKDGGQGLRAIMGAGSARRDGHKKKIKLFHEWLDDGPDYSWTELPADSFKNAFRSTGVSCWMLSIDAA